MKEMTSYLETLEESLKDYHDDYAEVVCYLPDFYTCFLNLLDDARFPARLRLYVNAAIAYLVSPADVIPEEEMGPAGYIDDIFLCAYVIRKIAAGLRDDSLLQHAWEGDESLRAVTELILDTSTKAIDDAIRRRILHYVGVEESSR